MGKKINWIVSYPKSGNTWMRAIITSMLFSPNGNFNFGLIKFVEQFEKLKWFNFIKEINKKNFKNISDIKMTAKYWIEAQERIIIEDNYNFFYNFFKTHSLNAILDNNKFTNTKLTSGVIYITRDPRDVAVSFAKHRGEKIDSIIDFMINPGSMFPFDNERIPTILSRWDYHYISWKKIDVPKIIIKYEDLINDPKKNILKIKKFLSSELKIQIDIDDQKVKNILNTTSFDNMKKNEEKYGFSEATKNSDFFRKGQSMQWKKSLSKAQINKIEKEFMPTMQELNYL